MRNQQNYKHIAMQEAEYLKVFFSDNNVKHISNKITEELYKKVSETIIVDHQQIINVMNNIIKVHSREREVTELVHKTVNFIVNYVYDDLYVPKHTFNKQSSLYNMGNKYNLSNHSVGDSIDKVYQNKVSGAFSTEINFDD